MLPVLDVGMKKNLWGLTLFLSSYFIQMASLQLKNQNKSSLNLSPSEKQENQRLIEEIDKIIERINTILNANRFTPFGGRRAVNQAKYTFAPNQILSHRVLNYDQN